MVCGYVYVGFGGLQALIVRVHWVLNIFFNLVLIPWLITVFVGECFVCEGVALRGQVGLESTCECR